MSTPLARATLLAHRDHWTREPAQAVQSPTGLPPEEADLWQA